MTSPAPDQLLERLRAATAGEYEIVRELGRGGFAAVYLGRDIALERDVAIKVLLADDRDGDPARTSEVERFRREARTVAKLVHPNIVPVYAVKASEGLQYFVMKFIKGRSLERVLETSGRLPVALVQTILQQAGSALAFAHRQGVVHRDIKPANVMLEEEGWAVVADFGIAKVARAEKLTGTGLIIGTAAYMSPEQWAGQEVSGASDQYSLGVVAYELLTGKSPFTAESVPAMLWAHLNEVPAPITDLRPDCPEPLARIVARMLEKEPAARYASLDEMVSAIAALPAPVAAEEVRTQLMTLAAISREGMTVKVEASGERSVGSQPITPSGKVARLTVSPALTTLAAGSSLRLTATPLNDTGRQLARRATAWRSNDARIATVDADGVLSAHESGTTTIVASCEGVEVEVAVNVTGTAKRSAPIASPAGDAPARPRGATMRIAVLGALIVTAGLVGWKTGLFRAADGVQQTASDSGAGGSTPEDSLNPSGGREVYPSPAGPERPNGPAGLATNTGGTKARADSTTRGATGNPQNPPTNPAANPQAALQGSAPPVVPGGVTTTPGTGAASQPTNTPVQGAGDRAPPPVTESNETKAPAATEEPAANPAVEVSAGGGETCASLSSGDKVLCWGGAAAAGSVVAGSYFDKLAVGGGHICGLTPDGAAFCWGDNSQGQLGDDTRNNRTVPTAVKATVRFTDISVGAAHSCALAADGSAWCWGSNKAGQLGDNSLTNRNKPVLVRGREAFQSLSAGGSHTCGVRGTKVYCWGDGFSGQLGIGMQENQREPFPVNSPLPFRSVVTGELHTCALTTSGRAWCWGDNRTGALGNDTRDNRDVPDSVATDLVFTQLTAGARHTCGITSTRAVACWGENSSGQLGDGTRQRREAPVAIARGTQWKVVSAGAAHSCGITRTDAVMCWGANTRGQAGSGAVGPLVLVPTVIKVAPPR